jgi:hypothetical protein
MAATRIAGAKLKAVVSALWPYYGLPPSRLLSFYYALPTLGYLEEVGYYPRCVETHPAPRRHGSAANERSGF